MTSPAYYLQFYTLDNKKVLLALPHVVALLPDSQTILTSIGMGLCYQTRKSDWPRVEKEFVRFHSNEPYEMED